MVVKAEVHLPGRVLREVKPVGRVAHGELVEAAVGEADGRLGRHDLERRVLGLVGEEAAGGHVGGRHVLGALLHVGGRGVLEAVGDFSRAFWRGFGENVLQ